MSNPKIEVDIEGLRWYLHQLAGGGMGYQIGEQIGQGFCDALKRNGWPGPYPYGGPCNPRPDPPGSGAEVEFMDSVKHV